MIRKSNNAMSCGHQSMINIIVTSLTNGFLKFLTRFSGRRRVSLKLNLQLNHCPKSASSHCLSIYKLNLVIPVILLLLSTTIDVTDACNSRTVPRPPKPTSAPQPTTTPRPNITFQTYKCPPEYATWYCLNGATCFTVKIGKEVLYNCECPDGYIGPRCDYKDLDGSYLAGRPRVMLETASIAGGAVAILFLTLVVGFFAYVRWHQSKKREFQDEEDFQQPQNGQTNGHHNAAADVVDGSAGGPSICQQSQLLYNSQLSSNLTNATNGDNSELQHPQQQQFQAMSLVHHERQHHPPKKRPFGPHHYAHVSMSDVLLKK